MDDISELKIQSEKLRVFYYMAGMSEATIETLQDDYKEIYEMHQKGINKLRDIEGLSVDKYKLLKYLGK